MRLITKIFLFVALLAANPLVFSQERGRDTDRVDTLINRVILRHEIMGGAMAHTGGIGLFFRKGYNENWFRKDLWEVEFASMKSDKQVRVNFYGTYYSNANSYVYGKLNKVFMLRGGLGQQHLLNTKPYWGGVELRVTYYGGVTLAMAKPVYLYIINQNDFRSIESMKYDPDNHFIDNIYGRAPFLDGLGKTKFHPGIYAKAGLNFEFGDYNTRIKALEAGILVEGYPLPIPIMAFEDPHYFFLNFYLSFSFGKRFNKY
jgi:hypothetical protein